jgi:hypothetical protein
MCLFQHLANSKLLISPATGCLDCAVRAILVADRGIPARVVNKPMGIGLKRIGRNDETHVQIALVALQLGTTFLREIPLRSDRIA